MEERNKDTKRPERAIFAVKAVNVLKSGRLPWCSLIAFQAWSSDEIAHGPSITAIELSLNLDPPMEGEIIIIMPEPRNVLNQSSIFMTNAHHNATKESPISLVARRISSATPRA